MPCNPLTDPGCIVSSVVKSAGRGAANDVLTGIAQAISAGIRWVVANTATWWLRIPSVNLTAEPAVTRIQQWVLPVTIAVATGGVIAAGARMALTRRANPLVDVAGGLVTIAVASTLGVTAATLLLKAGDAWSAWVLQVSTGGQFTRRLETVLQLGGGAAAAVMVVFGLLAIVVSLVQAVLMLFRQAALVILAGVLPLAAAGSIAPMTRPWIRKVTAWALALICYKPAAAAVYATAFTMIGTGRSARTILMGFVMLLLSVLTLPALMKFFTWTTGTIGAPSSGGGHLFGAATMGAIAVGALRGGGGGAQGQAAHLDSTLGPAAGGGPAAPPGGPPAGPGPGSEPGPGGGSGPGGSGPGGGSRPANGPAGAAPSGAAGGRPVWPNAGPGGGWSPWAGADSGPGGGTAADAGSGTGPGSSAPPGAPGTGHGGPSGAASGATAGPATGWPHSGGPATGASGSGDRP